MTWKINSWGRYIVKFDSHPQVSPAMSSLSLSFRNIRESEVMEPGAVISFTPIKVTALISTLSLMATVELVVLIFQLIFTLNPVIMTRI